MLYGRVKRSPHAHARIKSINASKALALPGVKAVVTGADFPRLSTRLIDVGEGALSNRAFMSENCIARDKVLYKGHALAAVAATSQDTADQALDLIEVDYEVLPNVMDGREAMKPNAPILHDRLTTKGGPGAAGTLSDDEEGESTNVAAHYEYATGDLDKGFAEAYLVVEEETHTMRGAPGIHRASFRHRGVAAQRRNHHLVQQPGPVPGQGAKRPRAGRPRLQDKGHPNGDWRRFRRQARCLPRASGRFALQEVRRSRKDDHVPDRGLRGHGTDFWHSRQSQDGRHQGRPHHRRRRNLGLRGRSLPRFPTEPRMPVHTGALQYPQRPH